MLLTPNAYPYGVIVEESFKAVAMDGAHVFFNAVGDDAWPLADLARMENCARFIEAPGSIHVLPTSQYVCR